MSARDPRGRRPCKFYALRGTRSPQDDTTNRKMFLWRCPVPEGSRGPAGSWRHYGRVPWGSRRVPAGSPGVPGASGESLGVVPEGSRGALGGTRGVGEAPEGALKGSRVEFGPIQGPTWGPFGGPRARKPCKFLFRGGLGESRDGPGGSPGGPGGSWGESRGVPRGFPRDLEATLGGPGEVLGRSGGVLGGLGRLLGAEATALSFCAGTVVSRSRSPRGRKPRKFPYTIAFGACPTQVKKEADGSPCPPCRP